MEYANLTLKAKVKIGRDVSVFFNNYFFPQDIFFNSDKTNIKLSSIQVLKTMNIKNCLFKFVQRKNSEEKNNNAENETNNQIFDLGTKIRTLIFHLQIRSTKIYLVKA